MMGIINIIWSILLFAFFARLLYMFKAGLKYKKEMERRLNEKNKTQEEVQRQPRTVIEMVQDALSGAYIPKHKAYQVVMDNNKVYYFSSWKNRQLFIDKKEEIENTK